MAYPSMSSTVGGNHIQRHYSDPFNEVKHAYDEPTSPTKAYIPAASQDAEKAAGPKSHNSAPPSISTASFSDQTSISGTLNNTPTSEDTEGLTKTLIYFSTLNPPLTILLSLFTIVTTTTILLISLPRRLTKNNLSLQDQLIKALAPAIRWQLRITSTNDNLNLLSHSNPHLSTTHLLGVILLSPLFSVAIMLAAWTAGTFWFYTTILGEPNQKQGKEVDGKSAARWVKRLWVRWLLLGL